MNRKEFIKLSTIAGIGIGVLPQWAFSQTTSGFTRDQLIGKGNADIIQSSYTDTMHKLTKKALTQLQDAAAKDGIYIEVVSAYRSFQRQKEIYEGKYKRFTAEGRSPMDSILKIIEYSTIPGTSRHHWGTDLDLIDAGVSPRPESVLQPQLFHGDGPFCKLKDWLNIHANSFGFFEVYTNNANRKGFKYEPWHFSYAPVSKPMLQAYKELDLKQILLEEQIMGAEYFTDEFIQTYRNENILNINPELL